MNTYRFYTFLLILISFNTISYEISTKEGTYGTHNFLISQGYNNGDKIDMEFMCAEEGIRTSYKSSSFKIQLSRPMDTRRTEKKWFNIKLGEYEVCDKYHEDTEVRACENFNVNIDENILNFLLAYNRIEINKVTVEEKEAAHSNYYSTVKECPAGTDINKDLRWGGVCLKEERIRMYSTGWFNNAYNEITKKCKLHNDKVTSHLKRFLGW